MNWKSKFLWITIIAAVIAILQTVVGSNLWPQLTGYINLAIAILTAISNAIAGAVTSQRLTAAKAKLQEK